MNHADKLKYNVMHLSQILLILLFIHITMLRLRAWLLISYELFTPNILIWRKIIETQHVCIFKIKSIRNFRDIWISKKVCWTPDWWHRMIKIKRVRWLLKFTPVNDDCAYAYANDKEGSIKIASSVLVFTTKSHNSQNFPICKLLSSI